MPRASNNRREDSTGSIVSGESGFAHTGSIVHNQSGNFIISHVWKLRVSAPKETKRLKPRNRGYPSDPCASTVFQDWWTRLLPPPLLFAASPARFLRTGHVWEVPIAIYGHSSSRTNPTEHDAEWRCNVFRTRGSEVVRTAVHLTCFGY